MARYAAQLQAPAEGFGRGFFEPFGHKKACYAVLDIFCHFCCSAVTLVTFNSKLNNFEEKKKSKKFKRKKYLYRNSKIII